MRSWDFQAPGLIAFGEGKAAGIGALVKGRISGKVLLVTGPVLLRSGTVDPVLRSLREAGAPFADLCRDQRRTHQPACACGLSLFRSEGCAALVACGGGGPWIWPRP